MKLKNTKWPLIALSLAICSAFSGCSPSDEPIEKSATVKASSRILILEETSRGENTFTIFRDKETGREYVHIARFYSGCVIELRKD